MSTLTPDILAAFGGGPEYAPKWSHWRDKDQTWYIADGGGLFEREDGKGKPIQEGWTGAAPGHGLERVECVMDHDHKIARLCCRPAKSEKWPPQEIDFEDLKLRAKSKGIQPSRFQDLCFDAGYKTQLGSDGWNRYNDRGFTWRVFDAIAHAVVIERMIKPRKETSETEHNMLVQLEKQNDEEQTEWAIQDDANGGLNQSASGGARSGVSSAQCSSQSAGQETHGEHQTKTVIAEDAGSDSSPQTGSKLIVVQAAETSQLDHSLNHVSVQGEVVDDLPACVDEDGCVTDLDKWLELAGIKRDFQVTDKESAEWLIGRVRTMQYVIEEAAVQVVKMIGKRLQAMDGLTRHYGDGLRAWAEPQLGVIKKGAKAGQYRVKNVRTLSGAVFFKKAGGAAVVDRAQAKEFYQSLKREDLQRYGIREKLTFTLPHGYECEVFQKGSDNPIDSEDYARLGITVKRDLHILKTPIATLVEAGEVIPGWINNPADPLGNVTIGGDKAWSWRKIQEQMKAAVKLLAMSGDSDDDEDSDDD